MEEKNPIQSAARIFLILETLAETGPIGLIELSTRLELHKSTVHRMLLSLSTMGYVRKEVDGKYALTFKLANVAGKMLANVNLISVVHPFIEELANRCAETVHFVQRRGLDVCYLDKVSPVIPQESAIRMASQVGLLRPLYCSGVGKAILAELSDKDVAYIWENSEIEKKTEYTIVSFEKLMEEIKQIRERGYAEDIEENEMGVRCVAVCIRNHRNEPVNAFSISAPVGRMTKERVLGLAEEILKTKEMIMREMHPR